MHKLKSYYKSIHISIFLFFPQPTFSGKTRFVIDLIKNRNDIINKPIKTIIYVYTDHQNVFYELQEHVPDIIFTTDVFEVENLINDATLVIVDDKMDTITKGKDKDLMVNFFIKGCHHRNCSIVLLIQNNFEPGLRTISINSLYRVFFDQPADVSSIVSIAKQMFPGQSKYLLDAYEKATSKKYGYLFFALHPASNKQFKVRSSLYPSPDCEIYVPNGNMAKIMKVIDLSLYNKLMQRQREMDDVNASIPQRNENVLEEHESMSNHDSSSDEQVGSGKLQDYFSMKELKSLKECRKSTGKRLTKKTGLVKSTKSRASRKHSPY